MYFTQVRVHAAIVVPGLLFYCLGPIQISTASFGNDSFTDMEIRGGPNPACLNAFTSAAIGDFSFAGPWMSPPIKTISDAATVPSFGIWDTSCGGSVSFQPPITSTGAMKLWANRALSALPCMYRMATCSLGSDSLRVTENSPIAKLRSCCLFSTSASFISASAWRVLALASSIPNFAVSRFTCSNSNDLAVSS